MSLGVSPAATKLGTRERLRIAMLFATRPGAGAWICVTTARPRAAAIVTTEPGSAVIGLRGAMRLVVKTRFRTARAGEFPLRPCAPVRSLAGLASRGTVRSRPLLSPRALITPGAAARTRAAIKPFTSTRPAVAIRPGADLTGVAAAIGLATAARLRLLTWITAGTRLPTPVRGRIVGRRLRATTPPCRRT
jgi:hypothetical protein